MLCFHNEIKEENVLSCCLFLLMVFLLLHLVFMWGFWSLSFEWEANVHPGLSLGQHRANIQRQSIMLALTPNVILE